MHTETTAEQLKEYGDTSRAGEPVAPPKGRPPEGAPEENREGPAPTSGGPQEIAEGEGRPDAPSGPPARRRAHSARRNR